MSVEVVLYNLLMAFECFSFFRVMMRRSFRKFQSHHLVLCILFLVLWSGSIIVGFDWNQTLLGPVPYFLIAHIFFLWLIFEISFGEAIVFGIANWLFLSMIEVSLLVVALQKPDMEDRIEMAVMAAMTGIVWLFYFLTKDKYNAKAFNFPIRVWILLDLIMFIIMAMQSFFAYVIVDHLVSNMGNWGRNLMLIGGIAIVILLFVVLYYCGSAYFYRFQKELVETQISQQKEYFMQLLQREEETKKFRHDVINDFLQMQSFCNNHECRQMQDYLEKITGTVKKISQKYFDVGNNIVNTILNYYFIPLRDKYEVNINGYMSEKIPIADRDLCIVCANLVKNAVEAVIKTEAGRITVHIEEGRDFLFVQVSNSYVGDIVFDRRGLPKTSKRDSQHHGIGIGNIKEIVDKNHGSLKLETQDDIFKAEVYLKKQHTVQE